MNVSRKTLASFVLAGLAAVASAADITTLDGSQGWVVNGTSGGGAGSLGTAYSSAGSHADGALLLNGDRVRASLGYGDNGGTPLSNYGTLGQLAAGSMSFDFFRSSTSRTNDERLNVAVKLFLTNGSKVFSLTWENAYNTAQLKDSDVWHDDYQIGGDAGLWWIRDSGVNYTAGGGQYTLSDFAAGRQSTFNGNTSTALSGSLNIIGVSFAVGSSISAPGGTFYGAADNLELNLDNGTSYAYNFRDPNAVSAVPAPAALASFGFGLAARLRRRKRA